MFAGKFNLKSEDKMKRKYFNYLLMLLFFISSSVIVKSENINEGHNCAIDEQISAQLQTVLNEQRHLYGIPGISAALITSKNKIWIGVDGHSSEKDSIQPEMVFGLGSVTKTYFAAIVMQLVEKGKLSLDDSIRQWLPDMHFINNSITIRQLLNHTSGLYIYQGTPKWLREITINPNKIWSPKEIIDSLVKEPRCNPGACWDESAADYVLLGMIIETATGKKAVDVLKDYITSPLGLKHTTLYPDESYQSAQLAHFWYDIDHSGKLVDVFLVGSKIPFAALFSGVWTSGAIISTAEDLAIFSKALFENRILSKTSLKQMVTPIQIGNSPEYGFSVVVDTIDKKTVYWHTGGIGYASVFLYVPDDRLTIAVLGNLMVDPKPIAVALYSRR
jgi:D-alanyl-D-alanine carboxypeptidase